MLVLLNLLNKLGKERKCEFLPSIISLFSYGFNEFNNILRAQILDSIDTKTTLKLHF